MSLAYAAWNIFQADHMGFDWMKGKKETLDPSLVSKYHKNTWIGIGLMIMTGLALLWAERSFLIIGVPFYVKMGFVAAIVINGFAIGNIKDTATTKSYASLSKREKLPLLISGAVSTISWIGAAIMALFLTN